MAGPDWLSGFMCRHPELSLRKPEATSISRVYGFNRVQVKTFFSIYKEQLANGEFMDHQIWHMDETGLTNVHQPSKVISEKGTRQVGKITSAEKERTVTVLCTVNAAGTYLPPVFIFPRKRMVDSLMNHAPSGAVGLCTKSGWTDIAVF
ncbi:Uncharacterised protein at_DN0689 [Pycnogonum litorale]